MNQTQIISQTQEISQVLEQAQQATLAQAAQNTNHADSAVETHTTQLLSFPGPTGHYAIGTTTLHFVDPEREEIYTDDPNDIREITAKVWYPSEEAPGVATAPYMSEDLSRVLAPELGISPQDFVNFAQSITTHSVANTPVAEAQSEYPVLIFSHGRDSLPEFNTIQAEELASQGYVVVGINHTYESVVNMFPDGRVISISPVFDEAEREGGINSEFFEVLAQSVSIKAKDAQFVLDELERFDAGNDPTGLFNGRLDLDRVGIFGFSSGGATAAEALSVDPRFQAGINLDSRTLFGEVASALGEVANPSLSQPFMMFNNEAWGAEISSDEFIREVDQSRQPFMNNLQNEGYEVTILGTNHLHFSSDVPFLYSMLLDSGIERECSDFCVNSFGFNH